MAVSVVNRTSFAGGQIDEAAQRDQAKTLYPAACRKARNMRILTGGAIKRRPGTWWRATLAGAAVGIEFVTDAGDVFKLIFSDGALAVYDSTNALVTTISSQPWTASTVPQLYLDRSNSVLVVSHQSFWPQVVSYDGTDWSVAAFVFDNAFSGGPAQPYYRYAAKGITLQPSGLSGSITLTASDDVFVADHVNAYFRYLGYPVLITAVADATHATGTVEGAGLPPTVSFTVDNASGFALDEEAADSNTSAIGIITGIDGDTITFVYSSGFGGITKGDPLVGDSSKSQANITSDTSDATPAAVVDWDEQAFSAVRGYPGCGATHRGRFYFANMRDLPRGVTASAAGLPNYFLIGDEDGDAFFELVPDYEGQRVLHVVTAQQGLVLTDKAAYYLPEYSNQPVTPSTIDFEFIAPIGASIARPIATEQGFSFIEQGANRVIGILPTGSVQAPWNAQDLSSFWTDLLTGPVALASNANTKGFPERYGFALNTDGTVACVKYQDLNAPVPIGWTPWDTANGTIISIFTAGDSLFAIVNRSSPSAYTLEEFDDTLFLDCCQAFTSSTVSTLYNGTTVDVMSSAWWFRGDYAVSGGTLQSFTLGTGSYIVGYDMTTELQPTAPVPQDAGYRHGQNFGLPRVYLHVDDTGAYTISGQDSAQYRAGESTSAAPPLRSEAKRWNIPGRASDLSPDITQSIPAPLQVGAMTLEVSF